MRPDPHTPDGLRELAQSFIEEFPWLGDPEGCRNRCVDASTVFLLRYCLIFPPGMAPFMRCVLEPVEHHWVCLAGLNVDFTARQFDPAAPFPKIWPETPAV